jgi:hypothetical protein
LECGFCEILRAMEPLTAEVAEKSRRARREERGNSFFGVLCGSSLSLRSLRFKAFLMAQISHGEVSDGMQP